MPKSPAPPRFDGKMKPVTAIAAAVLKPLLRSPLHGLASKGYLEISLNGRKSGKRYSLITAYKDRGDVIEIISPGTWWRNATHDRADVRVVLRGKEYSVRPETFHESPEVTDAFRHVFTVSASTAKLYNVRRNADGTPNEDDLKAATATCALVRFPKPA